MQTVSAETLQSVEAFRSVPLSQLQWWIDNSRIYQLREGEYLFKMGDTPVGTHVILTGRLRMFLNQSKGTRQLGFMESLSVGGHLPFSRATVSPVNCQVIEDCQVMTFPVEKFKELVSQHYELTQALVQVMTSRVRNFTEMQQQNDKMMALGKLSAGLAHELNNPASAIVRGSVSLLKHLKLVPETFKKVIAIKMSAEDVDKVNNKLFEVLARKERPILTLMQRTEMEEHLMECLDGHMVENSQEMSENFIEFGFTCDDMNELATLIPTEYLSPILNWINNNLVTEKMVADIQEASQRIEKLVGAIKNFTHMDRGQGKEYTNIHAGIKNTLTILEHKIKKGNIELVEHYDTSLPPVKAFVGELNQVWTNLIDNALDAMEVNSKGRLEITTKHDKQSVQVSIADNGPGIPDDIKNQIFDPFFTTKEIGKGTGLGLDMVSKIVRQHEGSIKVDSKPGRTEFTACFPIEG